MKITDYVTNALDILRAEFRYRREHGLPNENSLRLRDWCDDTDQYIDERMHTLGVTVYEFLEMAGADRETGANADALVFEDCVVKWTRSGTLDNHDDCVNDGQLYRRLSNLRPDLARHLAETQNIGMFSVQERIVPAYRVIDELTDDERYDLYYRIMCLAVDLGLRDVHMENWGFRGDDRETPVIFDFSETDEPGSYMDWEDLNAQFQFEDYEYNRLIAEQFDEIMENIY